MYCGVGMGGRSRGPWPLLHLKTLLIGIVLCNRKSLEVTKWPPNFQWLPPPLSVRISVIA